MELDCRVPKNQTARLCQQYHETNNTTIAAQIKNKYLSHIHLCNELAAHSAQIPFKKAMSTGTFYYLIVSVYSQSMTSLLLNYKFLFGVLFPNDLVVTYVVLMSFTTVTSLAYSAANSSAQLECVPLFRLIWRFDDFFWWWRLGGSR